MEGVDIFVSQDKVWGIREACSSDTRHNVVKRLARLSLFIYFWSEGGEHLDSLSVLIALEFLDHRSHHGRPYTRQCVNERGAFSLYKRPLDSVILEGEVFGPSVLRGMSSMQGCSLCWSLGCCILIPGSLHCTLMRQPILQCLRDDR